MKPIYTLATCALVTFSLTIGLYWFLAPNPVSSRIHFALFMSVVPALVALLAHRRSTRTVVMVYCVVFVVLQGLIIALG